MRYLKIYENFDFNEDDFDYEDEQPNINLKDCEPGKTYIFKSNANFINIKHLKCLGNLVRNGEILGKKFLSILDDGRYTINYTFGYVDKKYIIEEYIKETFNWNEDDFDFEEENENEGTFDFILDEIKKLNNTEKVIFILPKNKYSEFEEFCQNNNIPHRLDYRYYGDDNEIYVYIGITNNYKLSISYMPINREDYAKKAYPNSKIFKLNEQSNFDHFDFNDDDFDFEEEDEDENKVSIEYCLNDPMDYKEKTIIKVDSRDDYDKFVKFLKKKQYRFGGDYWSYSPYFKRRKNIFLILNKDSNFVQYIDKSYPDNEIIQLLIENDEIILIELN